MKKTNGVLDRVSIAQPCVSDWSQMTGDDQTRFCGECNKQVYDFSKMTRAQAERLVIASRGHLCARITRNDAGSIVTLEPLTPTRIVPRRPSPVAAAVLSATLSVGSVAPAMAARGVKPAAAASIIDTNRLGTARQQSDAGTASLAGNLVDDQNGMPISDVDMRLLNMNTGETKAAIAEEGSFQFLNLAGGSYRLLTAAKGYSPITTEIELRDGEQSERTVAMIESGLVETATVGGTQYIDKTLLKLYDESDLVVVASEGLPRTTGGAPSEGQDSNQVRRRLNIVEVVKGKLRKSRIFLDEVVNDEDKQPSRGAGPSLLFLKRSKPEGLLGKRVYKLTDFLSGRKKLDPADLAAYLKRLNQLSSIEHGDHAKEDIAEWMVQLAEDPATRYEGAHALVETTTPPAPDPQPGKDSSGMAPDDSAEPGALIEEAKTGAGENSGEATHVPDESSKTPATDAAAKGDSASIDQASQASAERESDQAEPRADDTPRFGDMLTGPQVDRLAAAVLTSPSPAVGDLELLWLFQVRKDHRLAPYVLGQIRDAADSATEMTVQLVGVLTGIIRNGVVNEFADQVAQSYPFDAGDSKSEDPPGTVNDQQPGATPQPSHKPSPEQIAQALKGPVHAFLVAVDRYYAGKLQIPDNGDRTQ
jgi:hypothetical protein